MFDSLRPYKSAIGVVATVYRLSKPSDRHLPSAMLPTAGPFVRSARPCQRLFGPIIRRGPRAIPVLDLLGRQAIRAYSGRRPCFVSIEKQFVRSSRPLYRHLVTLLEGAIGRGELPSGSRLPPERSSRSGCGSAGRPWSAPIASSSRAGCCVDSRARHVRLRVAGADRRAVRVARQDSRRRAALERLDASRHDPAFVGRAARVARGGRAGDRLFPNGGVPAARSITC